MMFWWVLQNLVVAALLAVVVLILIRAGRPGPVARHALWLIVLVKLAAPPVVVLQWPWSLSMGRMSDAWHALSRGPATPIVVLEPHAPASTPTAPVPAIDSHALVARSVADRVADTPASVASASVGPVSSVASDAFPLPALPAMAAVLSGLWMAGGAIFLLIQGVRTLRLARMVRRSMAADVALADQVAVVARQIGVRSIQVHTVHGLAMPLVWGITPFRPYLLWPAELDAGLEVERRRALIVHELAHVRRLDHWVGWLELAAGALWWWNPLFWYVRSQVEENAELACDAWVVKDRPDGRRSYAEALLAVSASAGRPRSHPMPAVGMTAGTRRVLERRLVMIMGDTVPLRLSRGALSGLAVLAFAIVPVWAGQLDAAPQNVESLPLAHIISAVNASLRDIKPTPARVDAVAAVLTRETSQAPPRENAGPQSGTATIRGRVLTVDGAPIRGARVMVRFPDGPANDAPTAATDENGRYEISGLRGGRLTVTANKSGYITLSYGQRRSLEAARPVEVTAGQTLGNIDFRLPKGGVIVARVTDDLGEPVSGARVQAEYYAWAGGERRLTAMGGPLSYVQSDDRGEARLVELPPGAYYVSATKDDVARPGPTLAVSDSGRRYAVTYSPGTTAVREAQRVTVDVGQEVTVAFPLVVTPVARVSGVVRSADGSAPIRPTVLMTRSVIGVGVGLPVSLQLDGSFSISNLTPGDYSLSVSPTTASPSREYAQMPISVTGTDLTGLVITTSKAAAFRGQVVFDTGAPPTDVRSNLVYLYGTSGRSAAILGGGRFTVNPDWSIDAVDVRGTQMIRLETPVNGWSLKAVMLDGKDVTDTPVDFSSGRTFTDFQIVLTRKRTDVSGAATDSRGAPARDYVAVIFGEEPGQWSPQSRFVAVSRADQQGRYSISGLPPGRYLAAAVEFLPTGQERDPELLEKLRAIATRLTLGEGQSRSLNLKLTTY